VLSDHYHSLALYELSHLYGQRKQNARSNSAKALGIALILPELLSFTAFSMYTEAIEGILIDGVISTSRWIGFVNKLCIEQGKYILIVCKSCLPYGTPSHPFQ
jgi:hypothetical protein